MSVGDTLAKYTSVKASSEIPAGVSYVILEFDTVSVDDGYDNSHSETRINYLLFKDKADWESEVICRSREAFGYRALSWVPVVMNRVVPKIEVTVTFPT